MIIWILAFDQILLTAATTKTTTVRCFCSVRFFPSFLRPRSQRRSQEMVASRVHFDKFSRTTKRTKTTFESLSLALSLSVRSFLHFLFCFSTSLEPPPLPPKLETTHHHFPGLVVLLRKCKRCPAWFWFSARCHSLRLLLLLSFAISPPCSLDLIRFPRSNSRLDSQNGPKMKGKIPDCLRVPIQIHGGLFQFRRARSGSAVHRRDPRYLPVCSFRCFGLFAVHCWRAKNANACLGLDPCLRLSVSE